MSLIFELFIFEKKYLIKNKFSNRLGNIAVKFDFSKLGLYTIITEPSLLRI